MIIQPRANLLARTLVPLAALFLAMVIAASGLIWRTQAQRKALAEGQVTVAQTAAIEGLRQKMDGVVAEAAIRHQDRALADLVNRTRAPALAAAPPGGQP